jgi:hypothetical protein
MRASAVSRCEAASEISAPSVSAARLPSGSVRARISTAAVVDGGSACAMSVPARRFQVERIEDRVALRRGRRDLLELARDVVLVEPLGEEDDRLPPFDRAVLRDEVGKPLQGIAGGGIGLGGDGARILDDDLARDTRVFARPDAAVADAAHCRGCGRADVSGQVGGLAHHHVDDDLVVAGDDLVGLVHREVAGGALHLAFEIPVHLRQLRDGAGAVGREGELGPRAGDADDGDTIRCAHAGLDEGLGGASGGLLVARRDVRLVEDEQVEVAARRVPVA